jgi:hypothetical protein
LPKHQQAAARDKPSERGEPKSNQSNSNQLKPNQTNKSKLNQTKLYQSKLNQVKQNQFNPNQQIEEKNQSGEKTQSEEINIGKN